MSFSREYPWIAVSQRIAILMAMLAFLAPIAGGTALMGRIGYFNPSGVSGSGGLDFGVGYGKQVDEMISVYAGIEYFGKSFEETQEVDTASTTGITTTTMTRVLYKHTVKHMPLWLSLNATLPTSNRLKPMAGLDLGYALTKVSYSYNDTLAASKIKTGPDDGWFRGFGWRIRGGAKMKLGYKSAFFADLSYTGNTVSREEEGGWTRELKMSGLGFGAGLELSGF